MSDDISAPAAAQAAEPETTANSGPEPGLENVFNRLQHAALVAEFEALKAWVAEQFKAPRG